MTVCSGCSCSFLRFPSSRAAMMVMLLAGPSPLKREKSCTSHFPNRFRSLLQQASVRCISVTALSSVFPEPISIASSSASLRASAPFSIIFSRGRSSIAHWLIVNFFISFFFTDCRTCRSSLVKVLFECFELIFAEYAAVPPGSPESGSISDELDEGCSNGIKADAQALVLNGGVGADEQCI